MYPNRNVAGVSLGLKHQDGYKMSFYFYQLERNCFTDTAAQVRFWMAIQFHVLAISGQKTAVEKKAV